MARNTPSWEQHYSRCLALTDFVLILIAVASAQIIRFGIDQQDLAIRATDRGSFTINYTALSLVLALGWMLSLSVFSTRNEMVFGVGAEEYRRVANATFATFGLLAIIAFSLRSQIGRGYVFIALPLGLLLLLLGRWVWRAWLNKQRKAKKNHYRTLIVGERSKSEHVARQIMSSHKNGLWIVGAVTEHGTPLALVRNIEVVANYDGIIDAVDALEVHTLILTSSDLLSPERIRELGWQFEERDVSLVVAASLTDIAGPRVHMRPVTGLPLMSIDYPKFEGSRRFTKRTFDLVLSSIALVALSPVFLTVALLVRFSSKGPVFFRQERVGLNGKPFKMIKFRSMVVDAEDQLAQLQEESEGAGLLFKMKNDPRVTKVGALLRKHSLDELPQFANVWLGEMSLVGPRPPLPSEVEQYEEWTHRRLLAPPGITGLWQVSGRSNLSWEDSVRLDLYYVENWSLTSDILILLRTIKTVLKPEGAY